MDNRIKKLKEEIRMDNLKLQEETKYYQMALALRQDTVWYHRENMARIRNHIRMLEQEVRFLEREEEKRLAK